MYAPVPHPFVSLPRSSARAVGQVSLHPTLVREPERRYGDASHDSVYQPEGSEHRTGPLPAGYRGSDEAAHFSVPLGEVDALAALLTGVVADARRDHVLPPRPADTRES